MNSATLMWAEYNTYAPKVKEAMKKTRSRKGILCMIEELFQGYKISENTADALFNIVDPEGKFEIPVKVAYKGNNLLV